MSRRHPRTPQLSPGSGGSGPPAADAFRPAIVALALALLVAVSFGGVAGLGFIEEYDDYQYVTRNQAVLSGLTWAGLRWAFTSVGYAFNWHPLTWLSHMADVSLFGLDPRGHHLVSLALHTLNSLLLLQVLRRATGVLWPSALVAALFAVHPLRVESVAWVAERKDVLSAFFWLAATGAYVRYARRPSVARYAAVVLLFALGLLAKPMLVTLPLTLVLLDVWPLNRLRPAPGARRAGPAPGGPGVLVEKVPLLLLSGASAALTVVAQNRGGALGTDYPAPLRAQNALLSLARYLGKTLWPQDLAVVYPFPWRGIPAWQWAAAAVMVLAVTAAAVRWRRRCPAVLWGWLWFLVTLAPVIGLLQAGDQAMADRYTYIPHVGLLVMAVWGLRELARGRPRGRVVLAALAAAALAALPVLTQRQVRIWRDGVTLFTHARAVTPGNWIAEINLGMYYMNRGEKTKAVEHFRETIRARPDHVRGHFNLGVALYESGSLEEAAGQYRQALALDPHFGEAHCNLGVVLLMRGRTEEAVLHFREALRANPRDEVAAGNLEQALRGRVPR